MSPINVSLLVYPALEKRFGVCAYVSQFARLFPTRETLIFPIRNVQAMI